METIAQILPNVLTAASAHQTKEQPISTQAWAAWLKLQTFNDPELEAMVTAVAEVCLAFKHQQPPRWLSLLGKAGVGKTHCASRVFSWMSNRCDWSRCEYVHHPVYWPRMILDLRSGDGKSQFRDMATWPVLMLDDIGAERDTTGFAAEQLNALLGQRVGKWTIITSNLMLEQLGSIDPRIADRIIREPGNQFVALDTLSFGLRKRESTRLPYAD